MHFRVIEEQSFVIKTQTREVPTKLMTSPYSQFLSLCVFMRLSGLYHKYQPESRAQVASLVLHYFNAKITEAMIYTCQEQYVLRKLHCNEYDNVRIFMDIDTYMS